jgi:hypothetical protein
VDWRYNADKVLTISNHAGGAFTPDELQKIERALQFKTIPGSTQGDRTFTISHSDGAGNTGTSGVETVKVETAPVVMVIRENFNDSITTGWLNGTNAATTLVLGGDLDKVLGRYGGNPSGTEIVSKTYDFGKGWAGQEVRIQFDMIEMDSWDGHEFKVFINGGVNSSRFLNLSNNGGISIGDLSNSNNNGLNSFPDELHFYNLTVTLDNNGQVKLGFGSTLDEGTNNESWGIDNVVVTTIQDTQAPTLVSSNPRVSSNPADNSPTFFVGSDLRFTFSEPVKAGLGNFTLKDINNNESVTIAVNSAQVSFSGNTVTLNPNNDLLDGKDYAVQFDNTAILDRSGNAYAGIADVTTLYFTASTAGKPVIELKENGKLIAPIQVNGNWYYHWDRSGNGIADLADMTTHDVLDAIFKEDFAGRNGQLSDTNDTYRYATLNGVRVALPIVGASAPAGYTFAYLADNNPAYNDLAAIWDANNAGFRSKGNPSGWANAGYWSSTPLGLGHAVFGLNDGTVNDILDYNSGYIALQVVG